MPRKRKEFSAKAEALFASLLKRGGTAASITARLTAAGHDVSQATVGRRMKETRGTVASSRARSPRVAKKASSRRGPPPPLPSPAADLPPLPTSPDAIPEGTSIEQLDRWIGQAEAGINSAEKEGNLTVMGQMLRVAAQLAEIRRKALPPPPADPNDSPDMIAAARRGREALHKLIESALEARP